MSADEIRAAFLVEGLGLEEDQILAVVQTLEAVQHLVEETPVAAVG